MKNTVIADFSNSESTIQLKISLFSFKEKSIHIVYTPHLDVYGYGNTPEEAMQSFNISLGEFLQYITNKKTIHKVLQELGWVFPKTVY